MHLSITGDTSIVLTIHDGPLDVTIDSDDAEVGFSPLHMLAGALATCTASVLSSYADPARLHVHGARLAIEWDYAEGPHRVGAYRMTIIWPDELPEGRRKALMRAAEQCTVHATLQHSPSIAVAVGAGE
jgi:uncharacterized OsmC-like protein